MADEEIEFALKQYATGGGRNVMNMDWAGTLDYINRLKASDESKEKCLRIFNPIFLRLCTKRNKRKNGKRISTGN